MITDFLNNFCSIGLSFQSDGMRVLYFAITTLVFFFCTLFCREYLKGEHKNKRFYIFWVVTYLSVAGVLFAADFFTLFMFFEIMSFASSVWVLQEENEESDYSGRLYLRISVICGLVMLYGIFIVYSYYRTLNFNAIAQISMTTGCEKAMLAGVLLLVGFGAKAGVFLLHIWLPRAHTAAPAPASAVLSGILTKTGIIGIIITSSVLGLVSNETWGVMLLVFGGCTMFTGAFLAIFSVNLKKTLACSSVSQIGFIVTGISCMVLSGTGFAYSGTLLHMLNHSMIKLVLFLCAGAVLKKTGSLLLNDIRGYGRNKPLIMIPFAICALSIAGVPGFSGYVSKTVLHEAVEMLAKEYEAAHIVGVVFTVTGGMTLCYMLKLFICLFVEKGDSKEKDGISVVSSLCLVIPALIVFVCGILPGLFANVPKGAILKEFEVVAGELDFNEIAQMEWFAFHTMKGGLISIGIGIALYFLFVRTVLMKREDGVKVYREGLPFWFDLEKYVYRPVIMYFIPFVCAFFMRIFDKSLDGFVYFMKTVILKPLKKRLPAACGNRLSYNLGRFLDFITGRNRKNDKRSFTQVFAVANEEVGALARAVERSLSFSMLLFGIGLIATLVYMVFRI